jgi:hypothetical protein
MPNKNRKIGPGGRTGGETRAWLTVVAAYWAFAVVVIDARPGGMEVKDGFFAFGTLFVLFGVLLFGTRFLEERGYGSDDNGGG